MTNKAATRQLIFFVLVFLLFYLSTKAGHALYKNYPNLSGDTGILITGAIFTFIIIIIYYLAKMNQNVDGYQAFNLSPGAACKGSSYLFQGDDETSKYCRGLAETPDGRCAIASFNCPAGFEGAPKQTKDWEYTSNSDSCWSGVKCKGCDVDKARYEHPQDCTCDMCSMWV